MNELIQMLDNCLIELVKQRKICDTTELQQAGFRLTETIAWCQIHQQILEKQGEN